MSANVRITPRVYSDLRNIARYTRRQWGKTQRDIYIRDLDKRFAALAEQPLVGKHRPDIREGYFCFPQGSHLIAILCDGCFQCRILWSTSVQREPSLYH